MSDVHVVCALDKGMTVPALILAHAVRKYASPQRKTIFHALQCEPNAFPLYSDYLLNCEHFEVRPHHVSTEIFKKFDLSIASVPSLATFARLAISTLVPEADRVLYLDCDVVINRSIDDLFDIDMKGFPIAACRDLTYAHFRRRNDGPHREAAKLLFKNVDAYFNAGVLLLDCIKWREANYFGTLIDFLRDPPAALFFADQDALNAIFGENYLELDPRWNAWALHSAFEEGEEEFARLARLCDADPWITHFVGRVKPWISFHQPTPQHRRYWRAAEDSPFLAKLIELYDGGPLKNTAYATQYLSPLYSHRRIGEFLCTVSKIAWRVEAILGTRQTLSSKLFGLGSRIYSNSLGQN